MPNPSKKNLKKNLTSGLPKTTKIGLIGLGNMGGGIARNLIKAKIPLAVWDISAKTLKPYRNLGKNVTVAEPGEMAATCAALIFVVPGS
ncbi:MAG: NAD(P)-binding domain-containing protein, partial [bacterium]